MRTPSLIAGVVLACGLALAARNESVVYTEGNLNGLATQSKAVLDMSQDAAMKLRAGRTDVSIPYASITEANAAADSTAVAAPGKKAKPVHAVTVEFTSVQGESRTMTLQMSPSAASHVLATIHKHAPADTKVAAVQTTASPDAKPASSTPANPDKPAHSDKQAKADKKAQAKADKLAKKDKKKEKEEAAKKAEEAKNESTGQTVSEFTTKPPAKDNAWWGDSAWKTTSNLPKWEQAGSSAAAQ